MYKLMELSVDEIFIFFFNLKHFNKQFSVTNSNLLNTSTNKCNSCVYYNTFNVTFKEESVHLIPNVKVRQTLSISVLCLQQDVQEVDVFVMPED